MIIFLTFGTLFSDEVFVNTGKYKNYYHMYFELTPLNCQLEVAVSERAPRYSENNNYEFSEGGQFEVFIKKESFPIKLPDQKSNYLILRMPSTSSSLMNHKKYTSEKFELFKKIEEMHKFKRGSVKVVIELNPYIETLSTSPLKLELTQPNIFFRNAYGRYISNTDPYRG